jgi:hypothetical protein
MRPAGRISKKAYGAKLGLKGYLPGVHCSEVDNKFENTSVYLSLRKARIILLTTVCRGF